MIAAGARWRLAELDPARWRQIEAVLDQVLDLPREQVGPFLEVACGGDRSLRTEVEALLLADETAGTLLEQPVAELGLSLLASGDGARPAEPVLPGRRIGPWRMVREIGRGGMGAVYLAERDDGAYEQQVALKLIKRGLDTDEILRRFLRERRILARLEHRHIAHLVDGGVTEDGLPWFAMEYVEGEPITTWCDDHHADPPERLRLFHAVCQAVQHAHQNLVVHRDLKPSNIFVTVRGEVKLLDFGIARLLGDEQAGADTLTIGSLPVLTPHYAAPEQIRGEAATTATDIYSLGVVLYELLAGVRPCGRSSTSLAELQRAVLEEEPEPPSAVRREWRHLLRGDLDNIVQMALRKEPRRRYPSVEAMQGDLERYRDALPVRATPPSTHYRLQKFVRRNRAAVLAGGALATAVVAGIIATMWQLVAAALVVASLVGGLAISIWQAQVARREARKAAAVRGFLVRVFEVADPSRSPGQNVTARELLDQGARRVETEFKDQPALRAEMLGVLGELYVKLGLFEPGLPLVERELELLRSLPRVAPGVRAAALRRRGNLLIMKGDWAAAESVLREAADLDHASGGEQTMQYAEDLDLMAMVLRLRARLPEAERCVRQSLDIRRRLFGDHHTEVAASLNNLGIMLRESGQLEPAEAAYRECLRIRRELLAPNHPEICLTLNNLAVLLRQMGRFEEAERIARESLAIHEKVHGENHALTASALSTLAALLQSLGRYGESESMFRRALEYWETHEGRTHPNAVASLNNLAGVLREKGDCAGAEPLQRESVELWRTLLGDRHPYYAFGIVNLAAILRDTGRLDEASSLLDRALEIRRELHGDDHPEVASVLYNQGLVAARRGDLETAERLFLQAMDSRESHLGAANPATILCRVGLASALRRRGRASQAEPMLRGALEALSRSLPSRHPHIAWVDLELGLSLQALGRAADARGPLQDAVEIREACYGPGSAEAIEAQRALRGSA